MTITKDVLFVLGVGLVYGAGRKREHHALSSVMYFAGCIVIAVLLEWFNCQ